MLRAICLALMVLALPLAAQTPAYSSAGTFYSSLTVATTHDCPLPATITAGDNLWIFTGIRDSASPTGLDITINTSDGWASAFESASTDRPHFNLWWKIADGSEGGENVNFTGNSTSEDLNDAFYCQAYRITASNGFASPTPYEGVDVVAGTGPPATVPTITPGGANRLAIAFRAIEYRANATMDSYGSESGCDYTQAVEAQSATLDIAIDFQTAALSGACSGASDTYDTNTPDNFRVVVVGLAGAAAGGQKARRPVVFQ